MDFRAEFSYLDVLSARGAGFSGLAIPPGLTESSGRPVEPDRLAGPGIKKAAREFEGYFISYLLRVMRETVPKGLIDNRMGEFFHSFYDQEIGLRGADAGGFGLARQIMEAYGQGPAGTENKSAASSQVLGSPLR